MATMERSEERNEIDDEEEASQGRGRDADRYEVQDEVMKEKEVSDGDESDSESTSVREQDIDDSLIENLMDMWGGPMVRRDKNKGPALTDSELDELVRLENDTERGVPIKMVVDNTQPEPGEDHDDSSD